MSFSPSNVTLLKNYFTQRITNSIATLESDGDGLSLVSDGVGPDLRMKSIKEGSGVTLTETDEDITIGLTPSDCDGVEGTYLTKYITLNGTPYTAIAAGVPQLPTNFPNAFTFAKGGYLFMTELNPTIPWGGAPLTGTWECVSSVGGVTTLEFQLTTSYVDPTGWVTLPPEVDGFSDYFYGRAVVTDAPTPTMDITFYLSFVKTADNSILPSQYYGAGTQYLVAECSGTKYELSNTRQFFDNLGAPPLF